MFNHRRQEAEDVSSEKGQHGLPKPCTEELTWPRLQLYATASIVTAAMTSKQVAILSLKSQF